MEMSNREIVHRFTNLETPINILAQLNGVSNDDIRDVLKSEGVEITSGQTRPKRHIVDPRPSKPYQGENKTRKPYTKSGLYTKEAKEARRKGNKTIKEQLQETLEVNGYQVSSDTTKSTKEENKTMPPRKTKAAEPTAAPVPEIEMSETLKKLIFSRLDELEIKMGYHQEQLREYEREYKELSKALGIERPE